MANKVITQVPALSKDIDRIGLVPVADPVTGAIIDIEAHVYYHVRDDLGAILAAGRTITVVLLPARKLQLRDFVETDVLPAVNAAEGT